MNTVVLVHDSGGKLALANPRCQPVWQHDRAQGRSVNRALAEGELHGARLCGIERSLGAPAPRPDRQL